MKYVTYFSNRGSKLLESLVAKCAQHEQFLRHGETLAVLQASKDEVLYPKLLIKSIEGRLFSAQLPYTKQALCEGASVFLKKTKKVPAHGKTCTLQ